MEKDIAELYMIEISTEKVFGSYSGNLECIEMIMKLGKAKLKEY